MNYNVSRRQLLKNASIGFGATALSALMAEDKYAGLEVPTTHYPAKAKNVGFFFMNGAPSQVDTFDPKPERLVRAYRKEIDVQANWKNVIENYAECYHCQNLHLHCCQQVCGEEDGPKFV